MTRAAITPANDDNGSDAWVWIERDNTTRGKLREHFSVKRGGVFIALISRFVDSGLAMSRRPRRRGNKPLRLRHSMAAMY